MSQGRRLWKDSLACLRGSEMARDYVQEFGSYCTCHRNLRHCLATTAESHLADITQLLFRSASKITERPRRRGQSRRALRTGGEVSPGFVTGFVMIQIYGRLSYGR